jgi:WD40 repeat protein
MSTLGEPAAGTNALAVWDVAREAPALQTSIALPSPPLLEPLFSVDGRHVAIAHGRPHSASVSIWAVASGQRTTTLGPVDLAEPAGGGAYAFSPDGRWFVVGDVNGRLHVWDTRTWTISGQWPGHPHTVQAIAFSPNGRLVATGSHDTTVRLWDATTHSELAVLRGDAGQVYSIGFSPDGQTLAAGTTDGVVKLWNMRTHREVATLKAHGSIVSSVAFSPDGRTLATISVDETMRLWKAPAFADTDR